MALHLDTVVVMEPPVGAPVRVTTGIGQKGVDVRFHRTLACLAFVIPLHACASFYVHDAAMQKQTDSAKAALTAINTDAIFDNETTYLDGLQKMEASVVTAKYAAQRDQDILVILTGTGPDGTDGLTHLRNQLVGYEQTLMGATDVGCDAKLWRAVDQDPSKVWAKAADLANFQKAIDDYANVIEKKCGPAKSPALLLVSPTPNLASGIAAVMGDLNAIEALQKAANDAQTDMDKALADAARQLSGSKPSATAVNGDLQKLQNALTDANPYIRKYASASLSTTISAATAALGPASKSDTPLTKDERSGIAVMQALFGVGDAFASPPRLPHPNALAAAQSWLHYVGSGATTELQSRQLQLADHQAQLAAVLTEIYYLSKAGESLANVPPKKLTGTQGVADLINSSDDSATRGIDNAVLYYAAAWTRGFTADALASRRGYLDERRAKLVSGRAAATAWLGSLKPAVDTLAEYGSGGFDPQVVVQLLQALGVGAIAVGVNK
jgi:hypothetical protein